VTRIIDRLVARGQVVRKAICASLVNSSETIRRSPLLSTRGKERGRKVGGRPPGAFPELILRMRNRARLDRFAIEVPRCVAEYRHDHYQAKKNGMVPRQATLRR